MSKKLSLSSLPGWPRLLSLRLAAAYCNMSEEHFKEHVPVAPRPYGKRKVYDRKQIDEHIDGVLPRKDWTELLDDHPA